MKEGIGAHIAELKGHAELGPKPKSVQPMRGEVSSPGNKPGENPIFSHVNELQWQASLKGEPAPLQLNLKERRASERLGKPPPEQSGPEHDPKLRGLVRELFGDITDQGVSGFIKLAKQRFPDLPTDEALNKLHRRGRRGLSFP
jgi:hypothetical protein